MIQKEADLVHFYKYIKDGGSFSVKLNRLKLIETFFKLKRLKAYKEPENTPLAKA